MVMSLFNKMIYKWYKINSLSKTVDIKGRVSTLIFKKECNGRIANLFIFNDLKIGCLIKWLQSVILNV